jgi:hypothetical protein
LNYFRRRLPRVVGQGQAVRSNLMPIRILQTSETWASKCKKPAGRAG